MAKVLLMVVTLVTLLPSYSVCRKERKHGGLEKRQFIASNGLAVTSNTPSHLENPKQRYHPFQFGHPNTLKNQTKSGWNEALTSKETHGGKSEQSFSTIIKNREKKTSLNPAMARLLIDKKTKEVAAKPFGYDDMPGSKRTPAAVTALLGKVAGNSDVQAAVVEKGIEVVGKLVDKQLQIIDEAQEKASDFLKKEIKLDITPEKGWASEDMFIPPGYHIDAQIESNEKKSLPDKETQYYTYPAGIGTTMMNGCWGTGYQEGDPCYAALEANDQCREMIDGAAFIGVGFDGRGKYSPESRKMSIIQRSCAGKSSYDDLQVPDTMNVHGIYDTTARMTVFTSRSEYQSYLQKEAGVSGSVLGFYAGVKSAWGSSASGAQQTNLAIFDIDIDRYEIFKDEVKPQDLSRNFLREFLELPTSYFAPSAPSKFQDFILRWGTHYIKSARFGGQLELRKTQLASRTSSKESFAEESEVEFKSLFWSAGAKSSTSAGTSSQSQKSYMSTSLVVQGGSQRIAALVSDMYSPTFKSEFTSWLESIPTYPKAFKFLLGSIADLVDFRSNDLFPDEAITGACELHESELEYDEEKGKYFYMENTNKKYCEFGSREDLESKLKLKRASLKRAIEVYMEEGAMSISDITLPQGCRVSENPSLNRPSWTQMSAESTPFAFRVTFDLLEDLKGAPNGGIDIQKSMSRLVQYGENKWVTANQYGHLHLYGAFNNGQSADPSNNKMSIFGLVLTYKASDGSLVLNNADYKESKKYFPNLSVLLVSKKLAQVEWPESQVVTGSTPVIKHFPCNVQWSNGLRFDPSDTKGKCLHFTASTKGNLFVVFAAVPSDKGTWYYVEMSPRRIAIYKGNTLKVSTVNKNAVALGEAMLFQSYFVCITESTSSKATLIEYGKSMGPTESGDIYLSMNDYHEILHVRFYSFGNGQEAAQVVDTHVVSRDKTQAKCKGDTKDVDDICVQKCHAYCDPIAGCTSITQGKPKATECNECRYAKSTQDPNLCLDGCPVNHKPDKNMLCQQSYDLTFREYAHFGDGDMGGFPVMTEFSVCLWLNVAGVEPKINSAESRRTVVGLVDSEERVAFPVFYVEVTISPDGSTTSISFSVKTTGTTIRLDKDSNWHHYCFTRNSITGEMTFFLDGSNERHHVFYPGLTLSSQTRMRLGGFAPINFEGKITGLNIWDRILTEQEVRKMAQTCDNNAGNLKDWYDIKSELKKSKYIISEPSGCNVAPTVESSKKRSFKNYVKKSVQ